MSQSKEQAQAMLSFHNVKCVFEVMCWVKVAYTHTHTHRQEHSWILSQTTLKRKGVTEEIEQGKRGKKRTERYFSSVRHFLIHERGFRASGPVLGS